MSQGNTSILRQEISAVLEKTPKQEEDLMRSLNVEQVKAQALANKSREQDIEQRKNFANKIYCLVAIYLGAIGIFVVLSACPIDFTISDTILGVMLGTTTANVLALFHFVARYLFSEKRLS